MALTVDTLREILRNMQGFRALREDHGIDTIPCPDGEPVSIWDLEYLLDEGLPLLPTRQREAILLCLVQNYRERDAAVLMGVSVTNPVAMYASEGLKKLLAMIEDGRLPRFRSYPMMEAS